MTRPTLRTTHTVAELGVSPGCYAEIAVLLRAAGYDHVFDASGMIDMTGIGLVKTVPNIRGLQAMGAEPDASFRMRIVDEKFSTLTELDQHAVYLVGGDGLDEVGRHCGMERRVGFGAWLFGLGCPECGSLDTDHHKAACTWVERHPFGAAKVTRAAFPFETPLCDCFPTCREMPIARCRRDLDVPLVAPETLLPGDRGRIEAAWPGILPSGRSWWTPVRVAWVVIGLFGGLAAAAVVIRVLRHAGY